MIAGEPVARRDAPFVCRTFTPPDFAVDLGTATLRVWTTASGVVEVSSRIGEDEASARYPLRGGVVVDGDAAAHLLHRALRPLRTWHARPPRVLATVPGDADDEERMALLNALHRAGAGPVALVAEPVAAAVGSGLAGATAPVGMLVDVGEGVTEVALLSRGVLLHRASIRLACADMRECIQDAAAAAGVSLSREEADAILIENAGPYRPAADAAILTIVAFVRHFWSELDRRIREQAGRAGICLTGGGALVDGVRSGIRAHLDVPVRVPGDPLRAVILGARRLLDGEAAHVWDGFGDTDF